MYVHNIMCLCMCILSIYVPIVFMYNMRTVCIYVRMCLCASLQFNNVVRQKETACEEAKNTYWLFLETTNSVQRKHYETDMPAVFTVSAPPHSLILTR